MSSADDWIWLDWTIGFSSGEQFGPEQCCSSFPTKQVLYNFHSMHGYQSFPVINQHFIVDRKYQFLREMGQGAYGVVWYVTLFPFLTICSLFICIQCSKRHRVRWTSSHQEGKHEIYKEPKINSNTVVSRCAGSLRRTSLPNVPYVKWSSSNTLMDTRMYVKLKKILLYLNASGLQITSIIDMDIVNLQDFNEL